MGMRHLSNRITNRYSVNAMYSLAAEQDVEIEDELALAQKRLRDLKGRISSQSKKNFVLERDVRYLDSRIGLLIQNRIAADEKRAVQEAFEEVHEEVGLFPDQRKITQYSNLFFLLQAEPRHVASLCRLVSLSEIDTLLQTVMFTLYGNQYEQREEHLLLTMFQVSKPPTTYTYISERSRSPVRVGDGVWLAPKAEHPRFAHDDDVHPKRPRSKLPQGRPRRAYQRAH
jgi:Ras GTPase-activating-like protein IQGAP2/3